MLGSVGCLKSSLGHLYAYSEQSSALSNGRLNNLSSVETCIVQVTMYNTHKTKLCGLSPRANSTDRATAAYRRSDCQLLLIEGATWSA
jgi:hypothetical protein